MMDFSFLKFWVFYSEASTGIWRQRTIADYGLILGANATQCLDCVPTTSLLEANVQQN